MNILITAVSRKVALVKYFSKILKKRKDPGKVITVDTDPLSPGLYFSDKHYIVPSCQSPDYIDIIKKICIEKNIKLIIPTIDEEIPIFSKMKNSFLTEGVTVLTSNSTSVDICYDKFQTYEYFKEKKIPTPVTYLKNDLNFDALTYPMFVKPRFGKGSIHSFLVQNQHELKFFMEYIDNPIIQGYAKGKEFTIDTLSDLKGKVISVVPRERLAIRSGVSDRGRTVKDNRLIQFAVEIAEDLNIIGPSNIQCKADDENIQFIEINPRFSGGIQLSITSGADFPEMIVKMIQGEPLSPCVGDFTEGIYMVNFENSLYLNPEYKLIEPL